MEFTKEEVRSIRVDELKLTQPQLADKMRVHLRTVRRWEIETGLKGSRALLLDRMRKEVG